MRMLIVQKRNFCQQVNQRFLFTHSGLAVDGNVWMGLTQRLHQNGQVLSRMFAHAQKQRHDAEALCALRNECLRCLRQIGLGEL